MNCPIDYHKHSTETVYTLIDEHKTVLPLQGYVAGNTNQLGETAGDQETYN